MLSAGLVSVARLCGGVDSLKHQERLHPSFEQTKASAALGAMTETGWKSTETMPKAPPGDINLTFGDGDAPNLSFFWGVGRRASS